MIPVTAIHTLATSDRIDSKIKKQELRHYPCFHTGMKNFQNVMHMTRAEGVFFNSWAETCQRNLERRPESSEPHAWADHTSI